MSSPKLNNQPLLYLWRAILRLIKIPGGIPAGYPQDPEYPGCLTVGVKTLFLCQAAWNAVLQGPSTDLLRYPLFLHLEDLLPLLVFSLLLA